MRKCPADAFGSFTLCQPLSYAICELSSSTHVVTTGGAQRALPASAYMPSVAVRSIAVFDRVVVLPVIVNVRP